LWFLHRQSSSFPIIKATGQIADIRIPHRQESLPCQGSAAFTRSMGDDGGMFIRDEFLDAALEATPREKGPLWDMPGLPLIALSHINDDNRGSGG
jgi:hypothetical protein